MRHHPEHSIVEAGSDGEDVVMTVHDAKMAGLRALDPSQPLAIAQGLRDAFAFAQQVQPRPVAHQRHESIPKVEAEIDGLLQEITVLREVPRGLQRFDHLDDPAVKRGPPLFRNLR